MKKAICRIIPPNTGGRGRLYFTNPKEMALLGTYWRTQKFDETNLWLWWQWMGMACQSHPQPSKLLPQDHEGPWNEAINNEC